MSLRGHLLSSQYYSQCDQNSSSASSLDLHFLFLKTAYCRRGMFAGNRTEWKEYRRVGGGKLFSCWNESEKCLRYQLGGRYRLCERNKSPS